MTEPVNQFTHALCGPLHSKASKIRRVCMESSEHKGANTNIRILICQEVNVCFDKAIASFLPVKVTRIASGPSRNGHQKCASQNSRILFRARKSYLTCRLFTNGHSSFARFES